MDNQAVPPETKETKSNKEWSDKLTKYAAWGTGIYFLILAGLLFGRYDQLWTKDINELGDFLAGAFGPVAFLWLVIGYLMQHSELKLNRISIEKQAQELEFTRLAYEQQIEEFKKSVEITKQSNEFNKAFQSRSYIEKIQPYQPRLTDFVIEPLYRVAGEKDFSNIKGFSIRFKNSGSVVNVESIKSSFKEKEVEMKILSSGKGCINKGLVNIDIYDLPLDKMEHVLEEVSGSLDLWTFDYLDAAGVFRKLQLEVFYSRSGDNNIKFQSRLITEFETSV